MHSTPYERVCFDIANALSHVLLSSISDLFSIFLLFVVSRYGAIGAVWPILLVAYLTSLIDFSWLELGNNKSAPLFPIHSLFNIFGKILCL